MRTKISDKENTCKVIELNNKPFFITHKEMMKKIDNTITQYYMSNPKAVNNTAILSCNNKNASVVSHSVFSQISQSENEQKKVTTDTLCNISSQNVTVRTNNNNNSGYKVYTDMQLSKRALFNIYLHLQHINRDEKTFYFMYTVPNTQKQIIFPNESTKSLTHYFNKYFEDVNNWWRVRNTYVYLNEGKTYIKEYDIRVKSDKCFDGYFFKHVIRKFESRDTNDIISFNTYYLDIDLNTKAHPMSEKEIAREQICIADKLIELMSPTSITFTRNGLQMTFSIHNDEIQKMNLRLWKNNENTLKEYVLQNVTKYVDVCSCDAVHIYRLPYSLHRKKKNGDKDDYEVNLYYLSNHLFTTEEILEKYTVVYARRKKRNFVENLKKDFSFSSNDVVYAIRHKDVEYFSQYIDKTDKQMSYEEKRQYIRNYDMIYFLQTGKELRGTFSSIFREDRHPSAFIDLLTNDKTNERFYAYTDLAISETRKRGGEGVFCADLIHFVAYVGGMTESEAFCFLCKIFFPTAETVVDIYDNDELNDKSLYDYINDNMVAFNDYTKNRYFRRVFNDKSKKLYTTISDMFIQYIDKFKKEDYRGLCVMATQEYIAEKTGFSKSYIVKMLSVFDYLGLLHRQPNDCQFDENGKIPKNYFGFVDITSFSFTYLFKRRFDAFNKHFPQMNAVTQRGLDLVRIDY